MRRSLATVFAVAIVVVALPLFGAAKKKKPTPKPTPTIVPAPTPSAAPTPTPTPTTVEEAPQPEPKPKSTTKDDEAPELHVQIAACPASTKIKDLGPKDVPKFLQASCRSVSASAEPTDISSDDLVVVACIRDGEATTPASCGLKASLEVPSSDGPPRVLQFVVDGEVALSLRTERIEKAASPSNGTALAVVVEAEAQGPTRATLVWRRGAEGYGDGRWIWFPLPMLTTDLSSSPQGYRLGLTPIAVAAGLKVRTSTTSRAYVGVSAFVAWNLLVPNDTQTLSNGTQVRINVKAFGGGLLLDASGWAALGIGIGHTFTTDARTDFRLWLYFGPRLLAFLGG